MKTINHTWTKDTSFPKITGIHEGGRAVYNLEEWNARAGKPSTIYLWYFLNA